MKKLLLLICIMMFIYVPFQHIDASTGEIVSGNHTSPFLDKLTNIINPLVPHALYWNTQAPFKVIVNSSELSGFLWGDSVGWIALNCSDLGSCGSQQFKVLNDGNGNLSGYAWGENTGWISFSCANPETNNCNLNNNARVVINPTNGIFSGYAWSENFGWLLFDCGVTSSCVKTTWRKRSGGGGGGGGGGSIRKNIIQPTLTPPPTVTPSQIDKVCTPLLTQYIQFGQMNNEDSVKKLEFFLNTYQGESLIVDGIYESADVEAVKRFQWKYREDILDPWRLKQPTGYVYITTLAKINSYQCGSIIKDQATCPYFTYYHKIGDVGGEVKKIQNFLNSTMNSRIPENGLFDEQTFLAVKVFQGAFFSSILSDWGLTSPTGKWGITTKRKANELIGCKEAPLYLEVLKKTLR